MKLITTIGIMMLITTSSFASDLPNSTFTPGVINPAVTQANIKTTICVPGYTGKIRPSASYTTKLKISQFKEYGITTTSPALYEEDHLISLELGGNATDPKNLWPESWTSTWNAHMKDRLENQLHAFVCSGKLTLAIAQQKIATDWISAYKLYFDTPPTK